MEPKAEIKQEISSYWDKRGKDYGKSPGHSSLPEVWKDVLSNVFERKMRILDVGTGTGFLALLLAELGHEVVRIDLSNGMLEVARERARKAGMNIEFKIGDAENLPFGNDSFDAVICRHLLWTLPNPQKAVKEWSRVVRNGGRVVVIEGKWCDKSLSSKIRRVARTSGDFGIRKKKSVEKPLQAGNKQNTTSLRWFNSGKSC
ncbi:class I SAM-dependent methyltransferase [Archaeoglobus sp.]